MKLKENGIHLEIYLLMYVIHLYIVDYFFLHLFHKGIKEVKTLVDLAMMSAQGQGAMEVQKVSCLHAAATGYGPLIYELPANAGFKVFLGQCKLVWRALEKDRNLPDHLVGI